jgi:hypothetical protein
LYASIYLALLILYQYVQAFRNYEREIYLGTKITSEGNQGPKIIKTKIEDQSPDLVL